MTDGGVADQALHIVLSIVDELLLQIQLLGSASAQVFEHNADKVDKHFTEVETHFYTPREYATAFPDSGLAGQLPLFERYADMAVFPNVGGLRFDTFRIEPVRNYRGPRANVLYTVHLPSLEDFDAWMSASTADKARSPYLFL